MRSERAKENYPQEVAQFGQMDGVDEKFSPACKPEINVIAESIVQAIYPGPSFATLKKL